MYSNGKIIFGTYVALYGSYHPLSGSYHSATQFDLNP